MQYCPKTKKGSRIIWGFIVLLGILYNFAPRFSLGLFNPYFSTKKYGWRVHGWKFGGSNFRGWSLGLKNSWLKYLATFFKHVGNSVKTHGHNHFGASLIIPHICTDLVRFAWKKILKLNLIEKKIVLQN